MAVSGKINWQKMNSIITVKDAKEDYLFSEQLKKIKSRCNEITENGNLKHETILGIEGERGSGKSSFLSTVRSELTDFYVMDIIDPSVFEDSMSIIELFISHIFKYVTESENENFESAYQKLLNQLGDVTKVLADFKAGKENFYRDNSYVEVLSSIKTRVNLRKHIDDLVAGFLSYVNATSKSGKNYKAIVLCIDDTDLISNTKIFNLLEEVRKYLTGNVIVIAAYYSRQLFDAVLQQKLHENTKLLEVGAITEDQVRDQVARYLEKLIPVNNRISLFDAENILNKNYVPVLSGIIEGGENYTEGIKAGILKSYFKEKSLLIDDADIMTTKEWIYEALNRRLRLKLSPVDELEETAYNLPLNLRGLLQLIMLITENMQEVQPFKEESDNNDYVNLSEKIITNLEIYESYLYSNLIEVLPNHLSKIIDLWRKSEYNSKNYLICDELSNLIEKKDIESSYSMPKYTAYLTYNIALGDVYDVLEIYKSAAGIDEKERYFVFALKVLYSIELLKHYLKACINSLEESCESNESLEIYLSLINAKMMPVSFSYFSANLDVLKEVGFNGKAVSNKELEDNSETSKYIDLKDLYSKILYSSVAAKSDFRNAIPTYSQYYELRRQMVMVRRRTKTYEAYKYYRLYNYEISEDLEDFVDTTKYPVDPLAFLGQRWYIENSFFKNYYVFYSMFDIDALVRFNYGRGDSDIKNALSSLIRKIYCILTGKNKFNAIRLKQREIELRMEMSAPIFYSEELLGERKCAYSFINSDEIKGIEFLRKDVKAEINKLTSKYQFQKLLKDLMNFPTINRQDREDLNSINERWSSPRKQVLKSDKETIVNLIEKLNFDFDISKYE